MSSKQTTIDSDGLVGSDGYQIALEMLPACKNVIRPVDSGGYGLTLPEPSSRLCSTVVSYWCWLRRSSQLKISPVTTLKNCSQIVRCPTLLSFLLPFLPLCLLERCGLCQLAVHCVWHVIEWSCLSCHSVSLLEGLGAMPASSLLWSGMWLSGVAWAVTLSLSILCAEPLMFIVDPVARCLMCSSLFATWTSMLLYTVHRFTCWDLLKW